MEHAMKRSNKLLQPMPVGAVVGSGFARARSLSPVGFLPPVELLSPFPKSLKSRSSSGMAELDR